MLDEFKELEEYLCPTGDNSPHRMQKSNVAKYNNSGDGGSYLGVPRALTIIARDAYYNKTMAPDKIIRLLNAWCGFYSDEEILDDDEEKVKNWLPVYLKKILVYDPVIKDGFKEEQKKKAIKDSEDDKARFEILKNDLMKEDQTEKDKEKKGGKKTRKELWNRDAFQDSGKVNDQNSIYFESIIADAIEQGSLKKRYLVFEKNPVEGFVNPPKRNIKVKDVYDRYLKLIASILLNKIPGSGYAKVNYAAYSNWVCKGCSNYNKVSDVIKGMKYNIGGRKDVQIVSCEELDKTIPLLTIDEEWIDIYKPRIIEEQDLDKVGLDQFVFEDRGCQFPLERIRP